MKKIICLLWCALFCFLLCACDPGSYKAEDDLLEDVTSIDLILYENSEQKALQGWFKDHFDELPTFDNSKAKVLETLPEEKISKFLDAFSEKEILSTYYTYDSPADVCIRLNYSNGNFLIIWSDYENNSFGGYIGVYSKDGIPESFLGVFSALSFYKELINDFFVYDISAN